MNMAKNGFWMYFLLTSSADIGLKWAIKVVTILVGKQSGLTVMSLRLPKSTWWWCFHCRGLTKGVFMAVAYKQSARYHVSSEKKHYSMQLSNLFSYSNTLQSQLVWMITSLLLQWLLWINNQRTISPWKIGLDIGWQLLRPIWVPTPASVFSR